MVCVIPSAVGKTQTRIKHALSFLFANCYLERGSDKASRNSPPGFLPVLRGVLAVGLGSVVSARADAAAECCAFLILVPSASQYWSPSVSLTEKIWNRSFVIRINFTKHQVNTTDEIMRLDFHTKCTLEWAGPCSESSLYSGWILLKRANSFTKHMGVFSLGFAMLDTAKIRNTHYS